MPSYPLEGLRVLDFSRVVAGPFATRMLSDMGADVVKLEAPEGDLTRHLGHEIDGMSGMYIQQNVGKRNVSIDLKAPGARELVLKLAAEADLVVENFRPGVMERFGLAWEDLRAVKPSLVMLSISGFGQVGPERERAAYAPVLHAETGIISRQAEVAGTAPNDIQYSIADTYSGLHGLVAAFAALRHAERTGEGQHIDIAMLNVMHATDDYAHWRLDDAWPRISENKVWDAPEGKQILITGDMKWLWHQFSTKAGLTAKVPDGADLATKIKCREEAMAQYLLSFATFGELTAKLDSINQPWGAVRKFGSDSFEQPTAKARGVLVDVRQPSGRERKTVQSPYKFSGLESGVAPNTDVADFGAHNHEVLEEWLNYAQGDISSLEVSGVLHTAESIDKKKQTTN